MVQYKFSSRCIYSRRGEECFFVDVYYKNYRFAIADVVINECFGYERVEIKYYGKKYSITNFSEKELEEQIKKYCYSQMA